MKLPGGGSIPFREFLKKLGHEYSVDAVDDVSAQVAYYVLFSLFPFLFFLTTLAAYLPIGSSVNVAMSRVQSVLPADAFRIVDTHLHSLVSETRPKLLTIGLLVSIWSASRGVNAARTALNLAYDVTESRPFWKVQGLAIGMTIVSVVGVLFTIALLLAGGTAGAWLAGKMSIGAQYHVVAQWLRWPLTALFIMTLAALTYYILPDVEQKFKFITPGSVIATLTWMLGTWGFGQYVNHFGNYNATYGSLGGVIVLLTWFYISVFIFLMGGEINAILEHESAEGKVAGERSEGDGKAGAIGGAAPLGDGPTANAKKPAGQSRADAASSP
jgi:membrane protein